MTATRDASEVPTVGWMLGASAWMVTTAIPGPAAAWLGFIVIGLVGRMPRWLFTGIGLGVLAVISQMSFWGPWESTVNGVVYLGGMVLALIANPAWLRALWARRVAAGRARTDARARSGGSSSRRRSRGGAGASASSAADNRAAKAKAEKDAAAEKDEARRLADRAGASTGSYFAAAPADDSSREPVDVNTADTRLLSTLPGVTRSRARSLVRQRERNGGFASLDAFATAAGLQPHELVRLRAAATCSPPPRGPRRFGRQVDY